MIRYTISKSSSSGGIKMESLEPKKLALLRIWQILKQYSDCDHPLTQETIAHYLDHDYGIVMERKAIGRNLSLLKEAGADIASVREGSYLVCREFEDSELRMMIDGILSSRYITTRHSKDLIDRICQLSNRYFKARVRYICSVGDWGKTENQSLFYNIDVIDSAIEQGKQIHYNYNKFGLDKKLHWSSHQYVSPYQMILHNQRYYLMAYSEYWGNMVFHRLDRITSIKIADRKATPLRNIPGYEQGVNYQELASGLPYMYTDPKETIRFLADKEIVDQIVDWFGPEVEMREAEDPTKVHVTVRVSPNAMEHWAMQYINHVEILAPESFRSRIRGVLETGLAKYSQNTEEK